MAGDWIKMRTALDEDPAVISIAQATGLDAFGVVGRLHKLWSWADQQSRDGNAERVTAQWIDGKVGHEGFAQAMVDARWLKILSTGISFPNFGKHNGKPAKERALTGKRVQRHRDAASVTESLPEKRREEPISTSSGTSSIGTQQTQIQTRERSPTSKPMVPAHSLTKTEQLLEDQRAAASKAVPPPPGLMDKWKKPIDHFAMPPRSNGTPPREPGDDEDELPNPRPADPAAHRTFEDLKPFRGEGEA